jgi:urease accessory protein
VKNVLFIYLTFDKMTSASKDHIHTHIHGHHHGDDHDHGHDHRHSHDHEHHHHDHESVISKEEGDAIVARFKQTRGRKPTPEEEKELREHGHTHERLEHAGLYEEREPVKRGRNYKSRAFTIGIGGPVGSGQVQYHFYSYNYFIIYCAV